MKWTGPFLVGIVIVILVFTFTSKKSDKKNTKQIIIGIPQEPDTLDPILYEMAAASEMIGLLFKDMVERDDKWDLHPVLVDKIPSLENGLAKKLPDNKLQVTWNLKKDLKWADGAPLTADDFIYTQQLYMDERVPVVSRDLARRVEKMEAPNPQTLVVTWNEPYAYFFMGHPVLPKHIVDPIFQKNPEKYKESVLNAKPVGNGPFQVEEWVPGSHLIFQQNPSWIGEKPYFEKVIYKIISNTNALESNMLSGTIDAISPVGSNLDQQLDFERRHGKEFTFYYRPALVWEHIDCNLDDPILKDKQVRQALMYGMNRQQMVDVLFQGKQVIADSWLPSQHYGYNPNAKHYPYDPEKAKKLLEEAGWIESPDGIRVNKRADRLRLTIMTTAGNKTREQVQQILQSEWRKIGVDLEIVNQPPKVFFGETMRHRKFKHLALYAWVQSPLSDGESLWTKENIPSQKNNWQGQNNPGWVNEEANKIDHQVPVTLEESKRKELLHKQQMIWTEEVPSLPLFFRSDVSATHKALKNWRLTGSQTPVTWNAEQWKFE